MNPYGRRVTLVGMGGKAHPLGFVVIRVQVEGVSEYNEDQVAFVVDDNTTFSWRVPVVLGTPTINHVGRVGHRAWPYPANYDDGSPIERHDPGPISR